MFIDLYFEELDEDEELESITVYDKDRLDGIYADPFTACAMTSNSTLNDPREFLLMVLAVRLGQVSNEWKNLVLHLECAIEIYVSSSR